MSGGAVAARAGGPGLGSGPFAPPDTGLLRRLEADVALALARRGVSALSEVSVAGGGWVRVVLRRADPSPREAVRPRTFRVRREAVRSAEASARAAERIAARIAPVGEAVGDGADEGRPSWCDPA